MDWIYHFNDMMPKNEQTRLSKIYFRPTMINEKGENMAGNMFIFDVYALDYIMDGRDKVDMTQEQSKELYHIYFEQLKDKDYFFDVQWKPKGHEYYLHGAGNWYLKVRGFNETDLLEWIKTFMQIHGIPFTSFKKAVYVDFLDENAIIRSLQKAAREGKGWWHNVKKE